MSGWFTRTRFRHATKKMVRNNSPLYHNMYKELVRADRDKIKESLLSKKRGMDAIQLPFVLPKGPQDDIVYIVYDTFYCEIPSDGVETASDGNVVRKYSKWLKGTKMVHKDGLTEELKTALYASQTAVQHPDTVSAMNHFLIENKFVLEGHLLWKSDYTTVTDGKKNLLPDKTRDFLTLVYHRAIPSPSGIVVDNNLFILMNAQCDTTSSLQITAKPSAEITALLNEAIKGTDTNISRIPVDKSLYSMVTVMLKPDYNNSYGGNNKHEIQ